MLRTHNLTKRFGAHTVVDRVDLHVAPGELHAIIGPNGAGKTTLFNLLSGELRATDGTIAFDGRDITAWDVSARSRLGMGRSFQRTNVFAGLSAFENVRLAAQSRTPASFAVWRSATSLRAVNDRAEAALAEVDLLALRTRRAGDLAGGEGRLLELAITLATEPRLLLLDEPSQGLSPEDAQRLIARIDALRARYTIVVIEHNMPLVMELADAITVLDFGRVLARGTPLEIRANAAVRDAYLGTRA